MRRGFHHIGLATPNFERCIDFYTRVLGFDLSWQDVVKAPDGTVLIEHVFFDTGDGTYISFMSPKPASGAPATWPGDVSTALGLMPATYHFSFWLDSLVELEAMRERLESHGVEVSQNIDHSFCESIYFLDPDGLALEFTVKTRAFNQGDAEPTHKHQPTFQDEWPNEPEKAKRFARLLKIPEDVLIP